MSPGDNLLGDRLNCPGEGSGVGLVLGYGKASGEGKVHISTGDTGKSLVAPRDTILTMLSLSMVMASFFPVMACGWEWLELERAGKGSLEASPGAG